MAESGPIETNVRLVDQMASPDILGPILLGWLGLLMGFGSIGMYSMRGMVLPVMLFIGVAFIILTIMCFRKGDVFGLSVYGIIGVFLLIFAAVNLFPVMGLIPIPTANEIAALTIVFGISLLMLGLITLKMPCGLLSFLIIGASMIFFMIGISSITGNEAIGLVTGYWSLIIGVASIYMGAASMLNAICHKIVAPILLRNLPK